MLARPLLHAATAALTLTALTFAKAARAEEAQTDDKGDGGMVKSSAGLKLFAGAALWSTPTSVPPVASTIGFGDNAAGFAFGGGVYYEARIMKFLGVEIDGIYDSSGFKRDITFNGILKLTEEVKMSNFRVPLLIKGILPGPFGRATIGIGPEFIVPLSADGTLVETSTFNVDLTQVSRPSAVTKGSTMLATELGLVLDLPPSLELPIALRASKNLSQGDAYADRVSYTTPPSGLTVNGQPANRFDYVTKAQASWDFRLTLGLGYRF